MNQIKKFLQDKRGDMAEKAAVWAVIILVAIGAFALLGDRIVEAVKDIANAV